MQKKFIFAAVAAIAIIITIFLWPSPGYIDKWGTMKMVSSSGKGEQMDSLLNAASQLFNQAKFEDAIPLLDEAIALDSSQHTALYYRGVSLYHLDEKKPARDDLIKVYNGSSVYRYEAAFFIALGYAEEKNLEQTMYWVTRIPPGTPVSEKAGELKEVLDSTGLFP